MPQKGGKPQRAPVAAPRAKPAKAGKPSRAAAAPSRGKLAPALAALENVYVPTRAAWRTWLLKNHDRSPGVWLVFDRKSSRTDRLAYVDSVEEALCFGWIDSTMRPMDADHYRQLFTPRKAKSAWARTNKDRVERLIADGLMTPAGLARIEEAKRTGSWTLLDGVEAGVLPADLEAALEANPKAKGHFHAFSPSARKGYLYWLNAAKRAETRTTRINEIVRLAEANKRVRD